MNTLKSLSAGKPGGIKATFLSSYTPRKCGIATFTKDLTTAIRQVSPSSSISIVAMDTGETLEYPSEVRAVVEKNNLHDYEKTTRHINASNADIVCLQHEYGLFGGKNGDYIFTLLQGLRQPIVTTLHTILQNPTTEERAVLFRLSQVSSALVAMIPDAKERLYKDYGISPDKVTIVHHGVPDRPKALRKNKMRLGWHKRPVLLMTGLLSPNKGVEYLVEALPTMKKEFSNILFVIAGQTHPEIKKHSQETYRDALKDRIEKLDLQDNVQFIDKYLSLDELLDLYEGCDIYLTPHTDAQQITSGTLAYALGMGKACVSTPYLYAEKMLSDGNGILANFKDPVSLATACLTILRNPALQSRLEDRAYALGRQMAWPLVATQYLSLFNDLVRTQREPVSALNKSGIWTVLTPIQRSAAP